VAKKSSRSSRNRSKPEIKKLKSRPISTAAAKIGRKLDAYPDRIDIRDWFYQPTLSPLPMLLDNRHLVPKILDQGSDGACTGFALAAVINFHLARRKIKRCVSPYMLYEMARMYDEWPGQNYEGSSARGAMIGWVNHGVCLQETWTKADTKAKGAGNLMPKIANEARQTPGGAYYRIRHREVRDMHAALFELGILYCTLMVHAGWDEPEPPPKGSSLGLPIIRRQGRADDGHAVALVGYTQDGFIVQNSWDASWGSGGFALLPYEDFMMHATDVWAAQLGVPVSLDLWQSGYADTQKGISRAANVIPLTDIRPYVIDCGNDGQLSQSGEYWTTKEDVQRLFNQIIPNSTQDWKSRRVMLYLHGGLNSEEDVARRIVAFRDVLLANEIYPIHIMWESGVAETLKDLIDDCLHKAPRAGGAADWLQKTREGVLEAWDRTLELTVALPGSSLWTEMKRNAYLSSNHPRNAQGEEVGAMQIVTRCAADALAQAADKKSWELHIVGHSAGSIYAAYALPLLLEVGVTIASLQFMAPAITIDLFKGLMLSYLDRGQCPHPTLYILSDDAERSDTVGAYGKSLLYLVSNAFEGRRGVPLLGMQKFISDQAMDEEGNKNLQLVDAQVKALFRQQVAGEPSLVIAGQPGDAKSASQTRSHGGFDNDPDTLNSVVRRILGKDKLAREFSARDLQY